MKVMYLIDQFEHPWGGTEGQLVKLTHGINELHAETSITVFKKSNYSNEKVFKCPVINLNIKKMFSPFAVVKIIKFAKKLKKNKYQLVHIFFNDASILAPIILKIFGLKVIVSRRDMGYWYNSWNLFVLRFNRYFVDAVITNSNAVKKITSFKEKYNLHKIHVIYNGINQSLYENLTKKHLRRELKFDDDVIVIGIVANVRPIKRINDAIIAISKLVPEYKELNLVVIGNDYYANNSSLIKKYHKLANDLLVGSNVHFIGAKRNVASYISDFNIGLLCSESEGLSNSIIEYMAIGLPTICTNVGGNPELVKPGATGYLYEPGDINQLVKLIKKLIDNPSISEKMSMNSVKYIKDQFSVEKYIQQHLFLYGNILQN